MNKLKQLQPNKRQRRKRKKRLAVANDVDQATVCGEARLVRQCTRVVSFEFRVYRAMWSAREGRTSDLI